MNRRYPRLRAQVYLGIFIGYTGFYLIRFILMVDCVALAIYFFAVVGTEEKRLMAEHQVAIAGS